MGIRKVERNKKEYLDLLLLADGTYELKNIAVRPDCQRKGYGESLIDFLPEKNFFIDNYNRPMFEDGVQLIDMIYLKIER